MKARLDARKTPLPPSYLKRLAAKRKLSPKGPKQGHYAPVSLRRAVKPAVQIAMVPNWTPNRPWHKAATLFHKKYGIKIAGILLRHRRISTTQLYAKSKARQAAQVAFKLD